MSSPKENINLSVNHNEQSEEKQLKQEGKEIKKNTLYAPKVNTEAFDLLKALLDINGHQGHQELSKIRETFQLNKGRKMKLRGEVKKRLINTGFIEVEQETQCMKLTKKGKSHVQQTLGKDATPLQEQSSEKHNSSKSKPIKTRSKNKTTKRKPSQVEREKAKIIKLYVNQEYPRSNITSKDRIGSCKGVDNLKMVINGNNFSTAMEKQIISERIAKLTGSPNQICQIEIGDFGWILDGKMLDYLVIKVVAEHFDEAEYKYKCLRAKSSGCDYIGVIFQFPEEIKHVGMSSKIREAITATRVYGLKVIVTKGMEQTISYLKRVTWAIIKKVRSLPTTGAAIFHFGSLERFNTCNKYTRYTKLQRIIIKCMSSFGFSKRSLIRFAKRYPTFKMIYEKLKEYKGIFRKKKVLEHFLGSDQPDEATAQLFLNTLFFRSYEEEYVRQKQEKLERKIQQKAEKKDKYIDEFSEKESSEDYSEANGNILLFDDDFGFVEENKQEEENGNQQSEKIKSESRSVKRLH